MSNWMQDEIRVILEQILIERKLQFAKWGYQDRTPSQWLMILAEEFGEVSKETCENHFHQLIPSKSDPLREELIQVAAVCVQIVQWIDHKKGKTFFAELPKFPDTDGQET